MRKIVLTKKKAETLGAILEKYKQIEVINDYIKAYKKLKNKGKLKLYLLDSSDSSCGSVIINLKKYPKTYDVIIKEMKNDIEELENEIAKLSKKGE